MKKEDFLKIIRASAKAQLTEQDESFFGSIGQAVEEAFTADSVNRKKEIEGLTNIIGSFDEGQTAASVIRALALKVDSLEEQAKRGLGTEDKYKLRKMLEDKKDDIVRARETGKPWQIEFKAKRAASAMMTTSTILTGATAINTMNVLDDMEVLVIQYPRNFVIDAIGGRQVSKVPAVWRWKEQSAESDGVPTVVTEGSTKPLTDKSFAWKSSNRAKYAGRIEFTEELAMDFDQLLLMVVDMFEQQVIRVWNAAVQTALFAYGSTYTSTGLDGTFVNPSIWQVIKAGKLWVENNNYQPDLVFLRPDDAALAGFIQSIDGSIQFLPDAVAFSGLTPIISTNVASGTIVIGTSSTVSEQHSNFILRRGVYGDQFIENEETIVGEVFSVTKLPTVSKASWLTMDIDTMKAALLKAGA